MFSLQLQNFITERNLESWQVCISNIFRIVNKLDKRKKVQTWNFFFFKIIMILFKILILENNLKNQQRRDTALDIFTVLESKIFNIYQTI